jgi:hypothetical protein
MTHHIHVSCNPNAVLPDHPVTCSPATMKVPIGMNHVQFVMAPGQTGTIAGIRWKEGSPFETEPESGNDWTGVDYNTNITTSVQEYPYNMGVTVEGHTYWSDPEIANEPGTAPRLRH